MLILLVVLGTAKAQTGGLSTYFGNRDISEQLGDKGITQATTSTTTTTTTTTSTTTL